MTDIRRAVDFYTSVLGFKKVFENGAPVGFVILKKDAAELHLTLDRRHQAGVQNLAHLLVDDAAALCDHLERQRTGIIKTL